MKMKASTPEIYFDDYKISIDTRQNVQCVLNTCIELNSILMGNYDKKKEKKHERWYTGNIHAIYSLPPLSVCVCITIQMIKQYLYLVKSSSAHAD